MQTLFFSLGSGSSGNSYYLSYDNFSILIDAGLGIRTIKRRLAEQRVDLEEINAVLITHDHADHIKAAAVLHEKHHIPLYTTDDVRRGMNNNYCVKTHLGSDAVMIIQKQEPFNLGPFTIEAFEVPHDSTDCVGYKINTPGGVFCFLTDLGTITPTASGYIQQAEYLIIEANYDREMLQNGRYPYQLKTRILGPTGHLCNDETAQYLSENFPSGLRHIWLCHISKDNNHPELAYKTVEMRLGEAGIKVGTDVRLTALRRGAASVMYYIDEK